MLILVLNQKENVCLLSSDFHSENPLTQTRTFHTQNRCASADKINKNSAKIETFRYLRTKNKTEFYSESENINLT